jgi:hypothetical protein
LGDRRGLSIDRQAIEEMGDGDIKHPGEGPKTGGGERDEPGFVFLDLLERHATGSGDLRLRQAKEAPTGAQPSPDTEIQVS